MSAYTSQGKATREFGIVFRSKLEATWAHFLQSAGDQWTYLDYAWCDFESSMLGLGKIHVEVKPYGPEFFFDAVQRAWQFRGEWHEDRMLVVMGEPDVAEFWCIQGKSENWYGTATRISGSGGKLDEFWIADGAMMTKDKFVELVLSASGEENR